MSKRFNVFFDFPEDEQFTEGFFSTFGSYNTTNPSANIYHLKNLVDEISLIDPTRLQNSSNYPNPEDVHNPYLVAKCVFIVLLTILIVVFNTTVIWVLTKYRNSLNLELYSYYNLSIAVADLMMGLFVSPLSIYPAYSGSWVYSNLACKVTSYLQVVIWIVVWCHFMWIGADRYLALRKPYKYENSGSRKTRYKCWIAFSWLTAALITSPHLYGYKWSRFNKDSYLCVLDWRLMTAYSLTVGALIIMPTFLTLAFTYSSIFKRLFQQYMHIRKVMNNKHNGTNVPFVETGGRFNPRRMSMAYDTMYRRIRKSIMSGRRGYKKKPNNNSFTRELVIVDSNGKPIAKKVYDRRQDRDAITLETFKKGNLSNNAIINNLKSQPSSPSQSPGFKLANTISKDGGLGNKADKSDLLYSTDQNNSPFITGLAMDASSYLLSFTNIVLFVISWIPWIVLKVHAFISHDNDTSLEVTRSKSSRMVEMSKNNFGNLSQVSIFQNSYHPELEFITSWVIISNSLWKPMFYFIFDKKFRGLVGNLIVGNTNQSVISKV
ncbi:unnamed protein product [Gordionus sp. m RMFG-2023]|uniref:muscarinic acetylcholine receptor M3-like isoform X3 n=1 Tax=Gordionus sp. m RMFG-2023 TaxID=3053472 RepID=UPI0030E4F25E